MRVLLVSWYFPHSNTIAAVRIGVMAQHLLDQGHDVRVVTPDEAPYSQTLASHFPEDRILRSRWVDVNAFPKAVAGWLRGGSKGGTRIAKTEAPSAAASPAAEAPPKGLLARIKALLGQAYMLVFNWPDQRIGWLPYALGSGRRFLRGWQPDLVFASGPPFTTLLAGYFLSRRGRTPLVLEFRDRWWDDPYYPPPAWLLAVNRFVERRLVAASLGLSTVSEPWAETYRARYDKPVAVTYNGYDAKSIDAAAVPEADPEAPLSIVYTGGIYPGRRDPAPLFEAMASLGEARQDVRIDFYGTDPAMVYPIADRFGVRDSIKVHPQVPHERAIALQKAADVLLLMQWDDPREQGNVPGKFFEYIGVLRPILILGLRDGVPASLARERGAGVHGANPEQIAEQLKDWIAAKRQFGRVPAPPEEARAGFARVEQFQKLEAFLLSLLDRESGSGEATVQGASNS